MYLTHTLVEPRSVSIHGRLGERPFLHGLLPYSLVKDEVAVMYLTHTLDEPP